MCGIAGYVNTNSAAATGGLSVLSRMTDAIRHRGPDDSRFFQDSGVFLGHRRLSIIDLAAGHQPMANEDGNLWIVYNGEIFNHADRSRRPGTRRPPFTRPIATRKPFSMLTSNTARSA